jgi:hypothetical protein
MARSTGGRLDYFGFAQRIGGGWRNRTPSGDATLVFKTSCRPFSGTLRMADGEGIEPSLAVIPGYGLASRRITTLPPIQNQIDWLLDRGCRRWWSGWSGSNRRLPASKAGTLPLRHTPIMGRGSASGGWGRRFMMSKGLVQNRRIGQAPRV